MDIIAQRPSQHSREVAEDFLTRICAESTLQLALMADAADEVSNLLRLCDKGLDTAELLTHVSDFAARIEYLFVKRRRLPHDGLRGVHTPKHTEQDHVLGSQGGCDSCH